MTAAATTEPATGSHSIGQLRGRITELLPGHEALKPQHDVVGGLVLAGPSQAQPGDDAPTRLRDLTNGHQSPWTDDEEDQQDGGDIGAFFTANPELGAILDAAEGGHLDRDDAVV